MSHTHYTIVGLDGNIRGNGSIQSEILHLVQVPENCWLYFEGALSGAEHYFVRMKPKAYTPEQASAKAARPHHAECRWDNKKMRWIDERGERAALEDARHARSRAYPSITDQLDALWHAMESGALPKAEPFYSLIANVKKEHPLP